MLSEKPLTQSALVATGPTVLVDYVDDDPVNTGFIGQTQEFQLDPGPHTFLLKYADLFQLDADQHEKIVSRPVKLSFTVTQGGRYQVQHPAQNNLEQAQQFAEQPSFTLIDQDTGNEVVTTLELSRPRSFLRALNQANSPRYEFASDQVAPNRSDSPKSNGDEEQLTTTVEALQSLWRDASQEEKKRFQDWISEQK